MRLEDCKIGMRVRPIHGGDEARIIDIGNHFLVKIEYDNLQQAWASVHFLKPAPNQEQIVEATLEAFAKV